MPATTARRPTSRRPRNSLTPEAIIAAAFAVSERTGGASLTFQALGAELDAHPTAIYRHFRDKDDLMLGLVDALHAEILDEVGPVRTQWQHELRALALTTHTVFLRHPGIAQYAAVRTARRRHEFLIVERFVTAMRSAGFTDIDAARYYRIVGDACLAYSAMDAALAALEPSVREGDLHAWTTDYRTLPAAIYPNITALAAHIPALDDNANYGIFIDLIIDALQQRTQQGRQLRAAGQAVTAARE